MTTKRTNESPKWDLPNAHMSLERLLKDRTGDYFPKPVLSVLFRYGWLTDGRLMCRWKSTDEREEFRAMIASAQELVDGWDKDLPDFDVRSLLPQSLGGGIVECRRADDDCGRPIVTLSTKDGRHANFNARLVQFLRRRYPTATWHAPLPNVGDVARKQLPVVLLGSGFDFGKLVGLLMPVNLWEGGDGGVRWQLRTDGLRYQRKDS